MNDNQELVLTIDNSSYGDFNGFEVKFIGFLKIPYPFYTKGWAGGKYLLNRLQSKFGKFTLTISKECKSNTHHNNNGVEVVLNFDDIMQLIKNMWQQNKFCKEQAINQSLSDIFPEELPDEGRIIIELPNEIREIIPSEEQLEKATSFLRRLKKYSLGEKDSLQLMME